MILVGDRVRKIEQISSELKVFKGEKSGASIRREDGFEIIRDRSQRMSQGWFEWQRLKTVWTEVWGFFWLLFHRLWHEKNHWVCTIILRVSGSEEPTEWSKIMKRLLKESPAGLHVIWFHAGMCRYEIVIYVIWQSLYLEMWWWAFICFNFKVVYNLMLLKQIEWHWEHRQSENWVCKYVCPRASRPVRKSHFPPPRISVSSRHLQEVERSSSSQ